VGEEKRILFTYDAFHGVEPRPMPGPVFIHADACPRYEEQSGFPHDIRAHSITLIAYGSNRQVLDEKCVDNGEVEQAVEVLLAHQDTRYLHVHDTQAGCYDFRIEKSFASL
jgi:hypothetical protein